MGNLNRPSQTLKKREGWKYTALKERLGNTAHEFEYELGGRVFDLALFGSRTLVEFDGPYHLSTAAQRLDDAAKGALAAQAGWSLRRIPTASNVVINPDCLKEVVECEEETQGAEGAEDGVSP
jgi:very-short-patch-repair endonuclease